MILLSMNAPSRWSVLGSCRGAPAGALVVPRRSEHKSRTRSQARCESLAACLSLLCSVGALHSCAVLSARNIWSAVVPPQQSQGRKAGREQRHSLTSVCAMLQQQRPQDLRVRRQSSCSHADSSERSQCTHAPSQPATATATSSSSLRPSVVGSPTRLVGFAGPAPPRRCRPHVVSSRLSTRVTAVAWSAWPTCYTACLT